MARCKTHPLRSGLIEEYDDGVFTTRISGFVPKGENVELPEGYTHFGVVVDGMITLNTKERGRLLVAGDFFSVIGKAIIIGTGTGVVTSAKGYRGFNLCGGPIEETGRLRYIDGCTDTLLVPPVRKGDPCFNHLHFPKGIVQTPHTHPSVRTGVVLRGRGECVSPDEASIPLVPGVVFIIETGAVHSFNSHDESMDIIAFHPDSDTGPTDDDHPMVNRTIVDGVSASEIESIRTR